MSDSANIDGYICQNCGWADFYPAALCPRCNGAVTHLVLVGNGKIETYTIIRYPPRGFENQTPYVVAIINIENGPKVIGRISATPENVAVGDGVSLRTIKDGVLEFQLASKA